MEKPKQIKLHLGPLLHRAVKMQAVREGVSMNTLLLRYAEEGLERLEKVQEIAEEKL